LIPNSRNEDLGFGELGIEILQLLMNVRFPNNSLVYHRNLPSYAYMVCVLVLLYCAGVAMNGLIKRTSLSFLFFHWEASEEEVMFSEQYFPQNKGNPNHKR
jgi:hypothetical protein